MQMNTKTITLSRLLPKTGQSIQYKSGDDGTYQAGWWKGLTVATNRERFIAKTIGGDDVAIDLATGLMWAVDGNEAGCNNGGDSTWEGAIAYANNLSFAGFSDWRLPNILELISIHDYSIDVPALQEPPFSNTKTETYWASTTLNPQTTWAWSVNADDGLTEQHSKLIPKYLRCVRGGL